MAATVASARGPGEGVLAVTKNWRLRHQILTANWRCRFSDCVVLGRDGSVNRRPKRRGRLLTFPLDIDIEVVAEVDKLLLLLLLLVRHEYLFLIFAGRAG